jgi:hypothetical protein
MPIWRKSALLAEVAGDGGQRFALLSLEQRRPFVLAGSAAVIWSLLDGTRSETDIVSELRCLYGDDLSSDMPAQVKAFLAQLEGQGLVEMAGPLRAQA